MLIYLVLITKQNMLQGSNLGGILLFSFSFLKLKYIQNVSIQNMLQLDLKNCNIFVFIF